MAIRHRKEEAPKKYMRSGPRTQAYFVKSDGMTIGPSPSYILLNHLLSCSSEELAAVAISMVNDREITALGKLPAKISDGTQVGEFTLGFHGNSQAVKWAMIGQDPSTNPGIIHKDRYTDVGSLGIVSFDPEDDGKIARCDYITRVSVKFAEIPSATAGGDASMNVTMYSDDGEVVTLLPNHMAVAEIFYDDGGSITNTNAPNGTLVAFVAGTGNESYATATTPTPVIVRPDATTDYEKYTISGYTVSTAGVRTYLTSDEVSYDTASKTWTLTTAPADSSKLVFEYAIDIGTDSTPPLYRTDLEDDGRGFRTDWQAIMEANA